MAKNQDKIKAKAFKHRALAVGLDKNERNLFAKNDFIAKRVLALAAAPDPFKFVITIKRVDGITIKSIDIEGNTAQASDFEVSATEVVAKLNAFIGTFTFQLIIMADGEPGTETTFTMTCDTKAVFTTAQKIKILSSRHGGFSSSDVKLP